MKKTPSSRAQRGICSLLFVLAALACLPQTAHAIPVRIESQQCLFPNSANGPCVLTWGTAVTAGELITVQMCVQNGFGSPEVTDSGSQVYTQDMTATVVLNSTSMTCDVLHFANSANGITTVTCKESASSGRGICYAQHWTGMATASVVDQSANFNAGNSSPWSSTAINTTSASAVLIGFMEGARVTVNSAPSVSGSWLINGSVASGATFDGGNGNAAMSSYQIVSVTGNYQNTGTDTGGANVTDKSMIIAYAGASSAACFRKKKGAGC